MSHLRAQLSAWLLKPRSPAVPGPALAPAGPGAAGVDDPRADLGVGALLALGTAGLDEAVEGGGGAEPTGYRFRARDAGTTAVVAAFAEPVPVVARGPAVVLPADPVGLSRDAPLPASRRHGGPWVDGDRASRSPAAAGSRRATSVCVVGTGAGAASLGQAVAARLARSHRPLPVVLAAWAVGVPGGGRPASSAARRLAATLGGLCDGTVTSSGRSVLVALPEDAAGAAADVEALLGRSEPCVVVLGGPRPPAMEAVPGRHDLVVVATPADAPEGLADLAATAITRAAPGTRVHQARVGGRRGRPGRALADLVDELGARA